ncbi:hypothetical protein [Chitinophaga caseinilytica]|uniref:Neutral/alkaline non-lysosomal ceramidase N-terminal domain-containing protein n=1 Tax=Chitinophaga caseinilytica TaxID=2267521 RepID=A0ABZ2Z175_9BACT
MHRSAMAPLRPAAFAGIIGVAQRDITPPVGIFARNWGAARHDVAAGIHRPLMLVCTVFKTDAASEPLVLIGADLGWWKSAQDERELREGILSALGLDASRLMFCLSHTHAGPGTFSEDAVKPGGEFIVPYLRHVREMAIAAAREALASAAPATLDWAYGHCALAVNRDLPEPGGKRYVVGMDPATPADDTLLTGRITSANGQPLGTIVNYACHPTTLAWDNELISPDYVGAMRETVESATGAPCLFLQGASGELSPGEQYSGDTALADRYGRQLGHAVLSSLNGMLPAGRELVYQGAVESGAPLGIWREGEFSPSTDLKTSMQVISMPLKDLPTLAAIEAEWAACEDHVRKERLWRQRGIRKSLGDGSHADMPLWVWKLGGAFLAGQPNEAYSDFQIELRRELAPAPVAVINIVNGYAGYLPPAGHYGRDAYAVWQTPFAEGGLELLTRTAIDISHQLNIHA